VVEDLTIKNMVRRPKAKLDPDQPGAYLPNGAAAKAGLNRSIHDAGWATLLSLLSYKAESAGRTVVTVDGRYTSQTCFECGHVEPGNRLSQAAFRCCSCGHEATPTSTPRAIFFGPVVSPAAHAREGSILTHYTELRK